MWWLSWFLNSAWSFSLRGWESSSVRETSEMFQRWCWGHFQGLGWHTYGLSKHADTILNWTEASYNWFCGLPLTTALFWQKQHVKGAPHSNLHMYDVVYGDCSAWCSSSTAQRGRDAWWHLWTAEGLAVPGPWRHWHSGMFPTHCSSISKDQVMLLCHDDRWWPCFFFFLSSALASSCVDVCFYSMLWIHS